MNKKKQRTLVDKLGWECVSFEWLIGGLIINFFPRLSDVEFGFNKDELDAFLLSVPSTVVVNFLNGNEGLSLTKGCFGIVKRSGGGGPCCWSFSLFSYFNFIKNKKKSSKIE